MKHAEEQNYQNNQQIINMAQDMQNMYELPIEPKKKRKWLKVIIWIIVALIILIMLLASIPYFLNLFWGQDSPLPNDQDLLLSKVNISREQNSYFDLLRLSSISTIVGEEIMTKEAEIKIEIPKGIKDMEYLKSYNWDSKLVEWLLQKNQEALLVYDAASEKFQFQYEPSADPIDINANMPVIGMNTWRQISRISAIKAIYLMRQGKDELAFEEAMKSVIIGQKIEESKNVPLLTYLVGIGMERIGLETMQLLIKYSAANPSTLSKYQNEMLKYYPINNSDVIKVEYMGSKNNIDEITKDYIKSLFKSEGIKMPINNFYFKPNQTLQLIADHQRQQITDIIRACNEKSTLVKYESELSLWKLYFTENAIGKMLINLTVVTAENVHTKKCDTNLMVNATGILFAIKKYYLENNTYPSNLQNLVPKYINELPIDPYSGEGFIINPNKKEFGSINGSIFSYDFMTTN